MMEAYQESVLSNEDSQESRTSGHSSRGTVKRPESDISDQINQEGTDDDSQSTSDIHEQDYVKKESASENGIDVQKTSEKDLSDILKKALEASPADIVQRPVISVRKTEDLLGNVNGNSSLKEDCPSPLPVEQHGSNGSEELGHIQSPTGGQHTVPASFSAQSSYRTFQQIGASVFLSAVGPTKGLPNLPVGIQISKRVMPQTNDCHEAKQRREEVKPPGIKLPDAITLVTRTPAAPKKSVADMLANRGITLVPTAPAVPRRLNSAVSITPSPQRQRPAPKPAVTRLPTVDLTKESDTPRRTQNRAMRMRGPTGRSVCQICDKAFPSPSELNQHMAIHRGPIKFECKECTAQYMTEAGLHAHRQKYHGAGGPSPDMAIPVVDLKQPGVLGKLSQLGIRAVVPLAQLHSGSGGGMFGLPVVSVDAASNPAICNIGGLGASNLLPIGPLKNISFNNNMR